MGLQKHRGPRSPSLKSRVEVGTRKKKRPEKIPQAFGKAGLEGKPRAMIASFQGDLEERRTQPQLCRPEVS